METEPWKMMHVESLSMIAELSLSAAVQGRCNDAAAATSAVSSHFRLSSTNTHDALAER